MTDKKTTKKILIITGGNVDTDFAALWVMENGFDRCIAVDRGAESALDLGLKIDLFIGDMDSVDSDKLRVLEDRSGRVRKLSPEKDDTDTALALEEALSLRPECIYILGATGNRADHTLTTLMSMVKASEGGVTVCAVDKNNKIYPARGDIYIDKKTQHGDFVSLSVISDEARISISGMKYNLEDRCVCRGSSLCQSNEIIGDRAHISVENGVVLVFESKDGD